MYVLTELVRPGITEKRLHYSKLNNHLYIDIETNMETVPETLLNLKRNNFLEKNIYDYVIINFTHPIVVLKSSNRGKTGSSCCTAQKMQFSITDFFSKCDQIRRKLQILSHLLKKSVMENFFFCAVILLLAILSVVKKKLKIIWLSAVQNIKIQFLKLVRNLLLERLKVL